MSSSSHVVLLHGVACSSRIWQDVIPHVSAHHDVHALALLGHHGGPAIQRHPPQVSDVVDAVERDLDLLGIDRPHLAGNSLGGWVAIELARRGRAESVCAFSPAGFWWDHASHRRPAQAIRTSRALTRALRPAARFAANSAAVRRLALRPVACHGDRLTATQVGDMIDDSIDCPFMDEYVPDDWAHPLDPLPCPVTLAWAQFDRLIPASTYGRTARQRLPGATWMLLPDVGHIPMIDDPALVARTILRVTGGPA